MSDFAASIEKITLNIGENSPQNLEAIQMIDTGDIKVCFKKVDSSAIAKISQESFPKNGMIDLDIRHDSGTAAYTVSREGCLTETPNYLDPICVWDASQQR